MKHPIAVIILAALAILTSQAQAAVIPHTSGSLPDSATGTGQTTTDQAQENHGQDGHREDQNGKQDFRHVRASNNLGSKRVATALGESPSLLVALEAVIA